MGPLRPVFPLAALAMLTLACRTVPATLPEPDTGAATRTSNTVFVESQPKPEGGRLFEPLSADAIQVFRCWFTDPYEYMFTYDGEPFEFNDRAFGTFMAGISGILYYGNLNNCVGDIIGEPPRSYSDLQPIERFAGVSATLPNSSLPFETVNPEIIHWARAKLLPAPNQYIDGIPVQLAYDRVFHRFFRVMAVSLFELHQQYAIAAEAQTYLRDTSNGDQGIDWLERRYTHSMPAFNGSWDGTTMTTPMAAGFWLRRQLDGSIGPCWHGLRDVLERYDPRWLAEQLNHYPNAQVALAQLPDTIGGSAP
ncbi:hypothetical protein DB30_05767 [Enhygromyxa salina]|uniref:Uncharacterized protein n=1 Tax=Enhygromyxa salina TaxID=215803 RepID=A0A0C1ZW24_9BACT|nr:hypothetical protein [Enhygromyxa salina]KIG15223.1 hypothetical protein DB30_05767 [Enhygromyxa salina]